MKTIDSVSSTIILILFITNIWVFTYRFILEFLNKHSRAIVDNSYLSSLIYRVRPEPYEIPLYIILTLLMVLLLYGLFYLKLKIFRLGYKLRLFFLLFLGILFYLQIGDYPMSQQANQFSYITPFMKNLGIIAAIFYILLVLSLIFIVLKANSYINVLVITIIAFLTFQPGFPISWHDYSYYLGPIMEVASGKIIFTDIQSQYGFLTVLFLALAVKIGIFKLSFLPILIWLLYTLQYFICFYLIFKISKSISLALLCLFSILTINYFSLNHLPISLPQGGAIRWVFMIFSLYLFYIYKNINSFKLLFFVAFLALFSLDIGIMLIASYILTIFIFVLKKEITLKNGVFTAGFLLFSIVSFFLFIDFWEFLAGGKAIYSSLVYTKLYQYSRGGFDMLPMPNMSYFWLVILIYFSSIIYYFKQTKSSIESRLLVFLANISFFAGIYFVGRSDPHNLFAISLLFLLNIFLLINIYYKKLQTKKAKIVMFVCLFVLFIVLPAFYRSVSIGYIMYEKINRIGFKIFEDRLPSRLVYISCKPKSVHWLVPEFDECLYAKYKKDSDFIKNNLSDKEILIISPDDTYLFYLTKKKNILYANPQVTILTKEDLDLSLKKVVVVCPKKIAVDIRTIDRERLQIETLNSYTAQPYLFESIQKKCNLKYVKSKCTDQICIAEAKKMLK